MCNSSENYGDYFEPFDDSYDFACNPKSEFKEAFISLWKGWLGKENLHHLDLVTEQDWSKFNELTKQILQNYEVFEVDNDGRNLTRVVDESTVLEDYSVSMNKTSDKFTCLLIPQVGCILEESWDYTYVLWWRSENGLEQIKRLVRKVGLYVFSESNT